MTTATALHSLSPVLIVVTAACAPPVVERAAPVTPLLGTSRGSTSREDLANDHRRDARTGGGRARRRRRLGHPGRRPAAADARLGQRRARKRGRACPLAQCSRATPSGTTRGACSPRTYLSQHRFSDALREAQRCQAMRADDAWVYGVIGDAHVERGEYDAAFDAFDRMAALKPTAASYARVSYARELQGDLREALRAMQMATEATSPHDPESLAWHHAQLGHLYLEMGRSRTPVASSPMPATCFPDIRSRGPAWRAWPRPTATFAARWTS